MNFNLPFDVNVDLTEEEKKIFYAYTRIRPCVVENEPGAHLAYLVVDGQSFCITREAAEDAAHASWFCAMLAKAIVRMIEKNKL